MSVQCSLIGVLRMRPKLTSEAGSDQCEVHGVADTASVKSQNPCNAMSSESSEKTCWRLTETHLGCSAASVTPCLVCANSNNQSDAPWKIRVWASRRSRYVRRSPWKPEEESEGGLNVWNAARRPYGRRYEFQLPAWRCGFF